MEKDDDLTDTLAEMEMLLRDNGLMTGKTMKLLERMEADGKSFIMDIKAMKKLISLMAKK